MYIIATIIILLATFENLWPLIIGFQKTPTGYVFLGTVHHPGDYFYYLSQFAQGAYRTITTIDLYTSEPISPSFIGWSNVLLGKFFFLIGLSPIIAYHTSVFILTILVFFTAYKLSLVFLGSRFGALISLYLFTLFHAFSVVRDGASSYGDYWNNFAVPRVRFGAVPHQLLLSIASFTLVHTLFRRIQGSHATKTLIGIACSSIIVGSLQPVLWASIVGIFLLSYIATQTRKRSVDVYGFLALGTGALPVMYLYNLFQSLPFSQLRLWEAAQHTPLTPEHFISAMGPILLIAFASIPFVLIPLTTQRLFLILFTCISVFMLVSPFSTYIHISHVRFMSTLTILLLSIMATIGLLPLLQTRNRLLKIITYTCICILSTYLLPNHLKTIKLFTTFTNSNLYEYLPTQDYLFFRSIAKVGDQNDVFLVSPPYNELFPGISGKRSYNGHHLLTIRASQKDAEVATFFSGAMNTDTLHTFLTSRDISWVICPPSQASLQNAPWASVRAKTENLVLYAVQK